MRKSVCVDLDGTLADYSKGWRGIYTIGDPIPGAKEFLEKLGEFADIIIYTCRCCEDQPDRYGFTAQQLRQLVKAWLDTHGLLYHDIFIGQGKPQAAAYIDDRGVYCSPQDDARAYPSAIVRAKQLCNYSHNKE